METTEIYGLFDPRQPDVIQYVGRSDNPARRLLLHICEAKRCHRQNLRKDQWILRLLSEGIRPQFVVLETVSIREWRYAEQLHIAKWRTLNPQLLNIHPGGDGLSRLTDEAVRKARGLRLRGKTPWNKGRSGYKITRRKGVLWTQAHRSKYAFYGS